MLLDEIDFRIIKILYFLKDNEEINTKYDMVLRVFPEKTDYEKRKNYTRIKRKLEKLENYGVIKKVTNGCYINWELQSDKVNFKKIKFLDEQKDVICIKAEDGWCAYEFK